MSSIRRRDFLLASAGLVEMGTLRLPFGPHPLDPRQPQSVIDPRTRDDWRKLPYTEQPSASPVHLFGSLVLPSGSAGSVPPAALRNPMGLDMELLEIKFEISGNWSSQFSNGLNIGAFGATIWCELMMGTVKLTKGSVPVWCFGKAENPDREQQVDPFVTSGTSGGTAGTAFVSYSWRLPRPMFIPAGAALVPNFAHTGMIPDTLNVRIGYSARTVFTRPRKFYVPYVAHFASKVFNPLQTAATDVSSELDLVNPNPEVFHLQRMVGRTLCRSSAGKFTEDHLISFGSQYLTMRMTDSYGRPIVRSFTPFRSIFSPLSRSWEMDNTAELDPEAFYRVEMKSAAMPLDASVNGASGQAFVSMVGHRILENP